jgi:hypothetical protein
MSIYNVPKWIRNRKITLKSAWRKCPKRRRRIIIIKAHFLVYLQIYGPKNGVSRSADSGGESTHKQI